MSDAVESWRQVVGFEGRYAVSDLGRVRSEGIGRVISQRRNQRGYFIVSLNIAGQQFTARVHRLVLVAFHGAPPPEKECAHLNGDQTDNRAANLAWVTKIENAAHKRLHGTQPHGETNTCVKLTRMQVAEIRKHAGRVPQTALAQRYGVHQSSISHIVTGKNWRG